MSSWFSKYFISTSESSNATHFYDPLQMYLKVPDSDRLEFWQHYLQSITSGLSQGLKECTHKTEYVQLAFDISFKFGINDVRQNANEIRALHESIDTYVQYIMSVVQNMLPQYFEYTETKSEYLACYLKKENNVFVWDQNTVHFDAKLIFPYARMKKDFVMTFYHACINQMSVHGYSPQRFLTVQPFNGYDTILKPIYGELIEMYGFAQKEGVEFPVLTDTYGFMADVKTTYSLDKVFNPQLHQDVINHQIPLDMLKSMLANYSLDYFLPLFFSIDYNVTPLVPKSGLLMMTAKSAQAITMAEIQKQDNSLEKLQPVRQLLSFISGDRAKIESYWIDIGKSIYSVDNRDDGLKLWKWFTNQHEDLDEDDCDVHWCTFGESNDITIATLEFYAASDGGEKYNEYRNTFIRTAMNAAIQKQSHSAVAEAFYTLFPHEYVCSNFEGNEWYSFDGNRWIRSNGTYVLQWALIKKFIPKLEEMRAKISGDQLNKDANFKRQCENDITLIGQLIAQLEKNGYKENLCREMKIFYYDKNFKIYKDQNVYLTGTPNGVLDVRSGKCIFRKGKPQDYITKSTKYGYTESFTMDHPAVKEVLSYIRKVYRNANVNRFFWKFVASMLKSGNADKLFAMFIGDGDNSKSMVIYLLGLALGNYLHHLSTSVITGKEGAADQATPALISALGAKVVILDEPNETETIRSGTVKKLTGNDMLFLRDLFQKGTEIVDTFISFKIIVVSNKVLTINDCQRAIWQRTTLIDHTSRWALEGVPETEEEQFIKGIFPMDTNFNNKLAKMAPAFLWLMAHYYEDYTREGLKKPLEVQESTERFRVSSNFYIQFANEKVRPVINLQGEPDVNAVVTLTELYNAFRNWFKNEQIKTKQPDKYTFKQNFEIITKVKASADDKWFGYRIEAEQRPGQAMPGQMPGQGPSMAGLQKMPDGQYPMATMAAMSVMPGQMQEGQQMAPMSAMPPGFTSLHVQPGQVNQPGPILSL